MVDLVMNLIGLFWGASLVSSFFYKCTIFSGSMWFIPYFFCLWGVLTSIVVRLTFFKDFRHRLDRKLWRPNYLFIVVSREQGQQLGHAVAWLVEASCYKPESPGSSPEMKCLFQFS
jgi:hypothetical protein